MDFARITALQPGAWQAWSNLGNSYLDANQPARAIEALRKAIKLAPAASNAWSQAKYRACSRVLGSSEHLRRVRRGPHDVGL